jgi:TP901 family phage tail tape measure protein
MATNTEKIVVQVVVKGQKELNNLQGTTKKATSGVGSLVKQYGLLTVGIATAVQAFRNINKFIGQSVRTFRDYEFQMAKVRAITGANNTEFKLLSESAKELGRSTFFTAQQVAELQTNFGKLGFTTEEILNAQEATLQLATATDTDLARAATVAGAAVRGFGLDASETQRVVDVMAVAFTSSALDIEKFQTSMTKVAPIAKAAGFSIEDTTAIMAQLSDAGIEASIAGTSLRNILLKMQDPNSDLVKSFGKTIHSLDELVPALTKFSKEGGDLAQIMEVVDLRQAAAFEQMITSRQRTIDLRDALADANGAAEEMARIVGDTLEGAFKRAQSATQGFQIALVEKFGNAMKIITDAFANLLNKITDFIEIPLSEKLNKDRIAMNDLFNTLKKTNLEEDTRNRLIAQLNMEYGEYLDNILDEKTTLEELETAQKNANDALLQKLIIQAKTEELQDVINRRLKNQVEAVKLATEQTELERKQLETKNILNSEASKNLKENIKDQQARLGAERGVTAAIEQNNKAIEKNKEEAKLLAEEYDIVSKAAEDLNIDLNKFTGNLNNNTNAQNTNKEATEANTQSKTIFQKIEEQNLIQLLGLQEKLINNKITESEFEEQNAQNKIRLLQSVLNHSKLTAEEEMKIQKMLNDIKINGLKDEDKERKTQIDNMAKVGDQLITLAGNDKKYQSVRKAGVRISAAAALATNTESLALQMKGLSADIAKGFPTNLIAVASTLALLLSMKQNFKALTSGEQFANGGMVHGKSHAQGGEKFAVGGRVVELEGGEAVINKRSTSMFRNQLSAMNAAGGGVKFADGGLMNMPSFAQSQFNATSQAGMMGAIGQGSKVVVVESDISQVQNTVSVIEAEATF